MPRQCCFLCASDEGVFLDITTDNKQIFHEKFEICSLVKVPTEDQLPTKLCHKCAYELNQCSSFVQKFKRSMKQRAQTRRVVCSLCNQPAKDEFIFDLNKDQGTQHNSFDRIQKVFNYDLKEFKENNKFICLSCRYTLDLLIDLKNVSEETAIKLNDLINEKIDYENVPKVHTIVVNRKTTITESARTNLPTLTKSNNNSVTTRKRIRNNVLVRETSNDKPKPRVCDKCQSSVKSGDEMFKTPKTKSTVCKKCWTSMGLDKEEAENQVQQNIAETKVCKVFLKDVMKDTELKEPKAQPTSKDGQSNKAQVATNKSVENESKPNNKVNDTRNGVTKQNQKRSATEMKDKSKDASNEQTATNKLNQTAKQSDDDSKEPEPTTQETKSKKQKTDTQVTSQSADSDSSMLKRKTERGLTAQKQATGSSLSDADIETKRNRKKLRNILEGISMIQNADSTDESLSNENIMPRRKRTRFSSSSPVLIPKKNKTVSKIPASPSKTIFTRQSKSLKQSKASQESQSLESETEEDIFDTTTYICDECGASYENKLMGLTHKLTHYKQPKVELQKLKDKDVREETPHTTEATDEQNKDQSETIAIRVDDDEEEVTKDTSMTESNAEDKTNYSKKETMEDAVDMELVMKESDDDCSQANEKKAKDSKKKEEAETDLSIQDKVKDKKQDESSNDNNNRYDNNDTYESAEKQTVNTGEKENTSLANVEDKQEEKENTSSSNIEATQEEKENTLPNNIDDTQTKRQEEKDEQEQTIKEKEEESKVDDNNEKEDVEEKVARAERKDSSEEEMISLDTWEMESEAAEGSQTNCTNKVDDDKINSSKLDEQERSVVENEVEVVVNEQSPSECTKKPESKNKHVVLGDEILLDDDDDTIQEITEDEGVSISKLNVSNQESRNDCVDTAAEVLQEVIDLASAEVQRRSKSSDLDNEDDCIETETMENISREVQNSVEVPSLE